MRYRELGKTGLMVSEIGLGGEHLEGKPYEAVCDVITTAIECGINILDCFMSEPEVRSNIGKALLGRRDKMLIQGHIGSIWQNKQYKRSRDVKLCDEAFTDLLTRLQTDYIDIGMIHYIDKEEDFNNIFNGDLIKYAIALKEAGKIRNLGISSHNPEIAKRAAESGLIDVIMFSSNLAYDLMPATVDVIKSFFEDETYKTDMGYSIDAKRAELYSFCEANGVGITVMKTLGGGFLLNEKLSPFGIAFTPAQCISYSLGRPAVSSVLIGASNKKEMIEAVNYCNTTDAERDYTLLLAKTTNKGATGRCVYCNHCLPCPAGIDIAFVNKYYDIANSQGEIAPTLAQHYAALDNHASDCISCGSCEKNCPFGVQIIEKMKLAAKLFKY